ncbi:AAA family ATPase [Lactococcus lactis]|uniref:ATP-dependent nuclease n=1 Tax=Lactococcus lactis TaxID=1358 RepID=UPI0024178F21|nr:TOPRIM nucleotidyl transferase/hydrolase domain-containing protein [Lactococcus lactis]MDG4954364.1 AAA family ATPase [Lactococcus lactis]
MIEKIKLVNYRGFKNLEFIANDTRNIFVGENGVGKTSILMAISYVLSGSYSAIEKRGFQSLFNSGTIQEFLDSSRDISLLPTLYAELYFTKNTEPKNFNINGKINTDNRKASGLQMKISPNQDFLKDIEQSLETSDIFPFEYYKLEFNTFAGVSYNSYNKKHKINFEYIDSTSINSSFAMKNYVSKLYANQSNSNKRQKINFDFRKISNDFSNKFYTEYQLEDTSEYKLKLKASFEAEFNERITAHKNSVDISDLGHGEKVLLGMEASLESSIDEVNVVLIEEPENHLSFLNMHKLIQMIEKNQGKQAFIATHSNMIASRLDLSNVILLSKSSSLKLDQLDKDTAKFFKKAPNTKILDFLLSKKAILVEGDAEYILMDKFYELITGNKPFYKDIALISCGGISFERYLHVAKILNKKVVVITDNDKDYKSNITTKYSEYASDECINVSSDEDEKNYTFEVCLYNNNKKFYEDNIKTSNMSNGMLNFMLNNKAEAALRLLEHMEKIDYKNDFLIPTYIQDAIKWID